MMFAGATASKYLLFIWHFFAPMCTGDPCGRPISHKKKASLPQQARNFIVQIIYRGAPHHRRDAMFT